MDFNGIVMFKVADKGSLLDLRFDFLASQGSKNLAVYSFDNDSTAEEQVYADAAVRARMARKRPKMEIEILGERAAGPLKRQMEPAFNRLASSNGDKAVAKISKFVPADKGGSGSFTVNLEIQKSKKNKVVVDVPFEGDPGHLAGKSFHGRASLFVDSSEKDADIPEIINTILDIT